MKAKLIIFIFLVSVLSLCFFGQVNADYVPKIYTTGLNITEASDNQIKGQFTVWNSEDYYFTDLNYVIKLFKGTGLNSLELIDAQVPQETLSVSPRQTIAKTFVYNYPKNIISGDYTLRIQVVTARGGELGWEDQAVSLDGKNNFLDIISDLSRVLANGQESFPLAGLNVSATEDVGAFLKVKNSGDVITVVPDIKIFKRQYNMQLVKQYQDSQITFAKGETKEITLKMPRLNTPESYLAEVKLYSGSEQVSGIQYFRWVVTGESGKILFIKLDKDSYSAGEQMQITVDSIGPSDLTSIDGVNLEVFVSDQNKNLVGDISKSINMGPGLLSSIISVPVAKDLFNLSIDAKITKNNQVLDEYKIVLPISSEKAQNLEKTQERNETIKKYLIYFIPAILVILLIGFLIFRFRKYLHSLFLK